jgi:4-hydroxy-tetrahydrodipicolinate reductase
VLKDQDLGSALGLPPLSVKISPDAAAAKAGGASLVGTGINPGYLMDVLPLVLTAPCLRADSVRVTRMMNSAKRRIPFQKKVGTGMSTAESRSKIDSKDITGHVGLRESIHLTGEGLGWALDRVEEAPPEAVIAERGTASGMGPVPPGKVVGLKSVAHGWEGKVKRVSLEFVAQAGVVEEYDEVEIAGDPDVRQRILAGVHGDTGTLAMGINAIPRITPPRRACARCSTCRCRAWRGSAATSACRIPSRDNGSPAGGVPWT